MNHQAADEIKVNAWVQVIRIVIGAAVIVALVFVGYLFQQNRAEARGEKAFAALYKAEAMEEAALRDATPPESATPTVAPPPTPELGSLIAKWSPEKKTEYQNVLKSVLENYSNTSAAFLAGLKLSSLQFQENQPAEAEKVLQTVVKQAGNSGSDVLYKVLALESLGSLYESQGKPDQALESFKKGADLGSSPLKPLSYLSTARVLRTQGKAKEAESFYQKVITEFPNSDYEKQARALMAMKAAG